MTRLFKKIMGIHEEEREKTLLMFAYIFLIIATLLILKPTRNSLFLTKIGISRLPYAFILVAATAILVTKFLTRLSRTIRLNRRILVQLSLSALVFMAFWLVFQSGWTADFIIYAFYAWVALFGLIAASDFWLLASYVFNAREPSAYSASSEPVPSPAVSSEGISLDCWHPSSVRTTCF